MVKGGGRRLFYQVEPNWTLPCSTPCQYHGWGMLGQRSWVTCCSTVQCTYSICARTMQESPKLYSKRLNSHGRQNTLPIWVYYLSMSPTNSTNTDRSHHLHSTALEWPKIRWRCKIRNNDNNINITYCCVHCPWLKSPKCTKMKEAVLLFSIHFVNIDIDSFLLLMIFNSDQIVKTFK